MDDLRNKAEAQIQHLMVALCDQAGIKNPKPIALDLIRGEYNKRVKTIVESYLRALTPSQLKAYLDDEEKKSEPAQEENHIQGGGSAGRNEEPKANGSRNRPGPFGSTAERGPTLEPMGQLTPNTKTIAGPIPNRNGKC